jgi:hypothetical protein
MMKKLVNNREMSSLMPLLMLAVLLSACGRMKSEVANKSDTKATAPVSESATKATVPVSETEASNFSGKWTGPMETPRFNAQMELALLHEGTQLSAQARLFRESEWKPWRPIRDLKVSGNDISFKIELGADVQFNGRLNGDKLSGTLTAFQGTEVIGTGTWNLSKS